MLEIKKNTYVIKSKILGFKIVGKDGKFWVVVNLGKIDKEEQSAFSDEFTSEAGAKAFLDACAGSL